LLYDNQMRRAVPEPSLAELEDDRRAAPRALPRRHGEKGRPPKPPSPVAARPGTAGFQLALIASVPARDYRRVRFDLRRDQAPASPWLPGPCTWPISLARLAAGSPSPAAACSGHSSRCWPATRAVRPGVIRALQLDDADLQSGPLRLAGTDRPMGELTARVLRERLEYRQRRWPRTANPHLLVSRESALHHGPVSARLPHQPARAARHP
jgi:hypothetical protein